MSEVLKSKKNPLFSCINSGKLETTVTPRLHYTRLDYTILPFLRHLTYLQLCPSLGFSSVLQLSLFLWLSFHEDLQSCFTDMQCMRNAMLWLCPRFGFSSLLQHNLLFWLSSYEALQSSSTNIRPLTSVLQYTILCSTFCKRKTIRFDQLLIHYSNI